MKSKPQIAWGHGVNWEHDTLAMCKSEFESLWLHYVFGLRRMVDRLTGLASLVPLARARFSYFPKK